MKNWKEMMEEALENYGPEDLVTIMLSQRVDEEVVEEQRGLLNERVG